jgi:hypothetical protein
VSCPLIYFNLLHLIFKKMAHYYKNRPSASTGPVKTNAKKVAEPPVLSEFDKYRESLLSIDAEEGWASELRQYLGSMQREVTKDTDLVEWWQVSCIVS